MVKLILVLFALLAAACGPLPVSGGSAASPRPTDLFRFTSDRDDYVGLGQSKAFTAADAKFVVEPGTTRGYLQLVVERGDEYWSIDLAAPIGHMLEVRTYENAGEPPSRTDKSPLLWIYGEGRSCNGSSGKFTITQIAFDQRGRLVALQATFLQRCTAPITGDLSGTIAYGLPQ